MKFSSFYEFKKDQQPRQLYEEIQNQWCYTRTLNCSSVWRIWFYKNLLYACHYNSGHNYLISFSGKPSKHNVGKRHYRGTPRSFGQRPILPLFCWTFCRVLGSMFFAHIDSSDHSVPVQQTAKKSGWDFGRKK